MAYLNRTQKFQLYMERLRHHKLFPCRMLHRMVPEQGQTLAEKSVQRTIASLAAATYVAQERDIGLIRAPGVHVARVLNHRDRVAALGGEV